MKNQAPLHGVSLDDYLHIVRSGPSQYLHRPGILEDAGHHVARFGSRALISGGRRALEAAETSLIRSLERAGIETKVNVFIGESSESNVKKLLHLADDWRPDFVIGCGGGKALDTAKIAADIAGIPVVTVPTIAATCAANTPLAIVYSDDGVYQRDYYPVTNPHMVLVDTEIQMRAPVQYLTSGILDSLAKWYEGGASFERASGPDLFDSIAITLAEYLNSSMMAKAAAAIDAAERRTASTDFVDVVDMNIYLAGTIQAFGVKAVRNGVAHSVHNGLTGLEASHGLLHGIKVGYGIAVQLALFERSGERPRALARLYDEIGFNPTFVGLGLPFTAGNLGDVADKTVADPLMKREPFDSVTAAMIVDAMEFLETNVAPKRG